MKIMKVIREVIASCPIPYHSCKFVFVAQEVQHMMPLEKIGDLLCILQIPKSRDSLRLQYTLTSQKYIMSKQGESFSILSLNIQHKLRSKLFHSLSVEGKPLHSNTVPKMSLIRHQTVAEYCVECFFPSPSNVMPHQ